MPPKSSKSASHNKTKNVPTQSFVSSKPAAFEIGDLLEYRMQRLQIHMGYFVRRSRPIYTVANLDRATDLDVFSLRYVEPFSSEVLITECKSGNLGPLDRIFWLAGVKKFVSAKEALLVRKGTKWNIKEFAKQCDVQILDLFRIDELEKTFLINDSDWPGLSDRDFLQNEIKEWNKTVINDKRVWEILATLTSEIKYHEPFPAINYLLSQMRLLSKSLSEFPKNSFYRYLLAECISQFLLFCMKISEHCFDLKKEDREGFIRKGLTYGSIDPRYADRILQSAYNLTKQSVLHYTKNEVEIDKSIFQMPETPGTSGVISIVNGIISSYPASLQLPQTCDLLLTELFTKNKSYDGILKKIIIQKSLDPQVKITRWYLSILIDLGACPSYLIDLLTFSKPGEKDILGSNNGLACDISKQDSKPKSQLNMFEKANEKKS